MKKQNLHKHFPFLLALALVGAIAWYNHVYVNWNLSLFPVAVALSVLVFLALAVSVIWPGENKPAKKCLQIFGWLAGFVAVQQGGSYLINNVIYGESGGAKPAMRVVLPLLALLAVLLLRGPWLALHKTNGRAAVAFLALTLSATAVAAFVSGAGEARTALRHAVYYRGIGGKSIPPNPIEKEGWILDRHDEFDGPALDETLWVPRYFESRRPPGTTDALYLPGRLHCAANTRRLCARVELTDRREDLPPRQ